MSDAAKRERMLVDVEDLRVALVPVDGKGRARDTLAAIKRQRAARDRLKAALTRRGGGS